MAIETRRPPVGAIIHSDHGVQFGSWAFTTRAQQSGLVASMGSVGDCYDCEHFGVAAVAV
jgi:putative transposase